MRDQAWKLREMMKSLDGEQAIETPRGTESPAEQPKPDRLRNDARVIAVSSGKGGVGKSHLSANLAYCLARAGRRTLLIDADLGTANLDLLLGMTPGYNLGHAVSGQVDLAATMMEGPGGLLFLPGASGLANVADMDDAARGRLLDELLGIEQDVDLIVIDTGAGISQNVTAFAKAADDVIVVTTPEPTAITDAYALIKVLHRGGCEGRIAVVVNQVRDRSEGRAVFARLAKTSSRFLGRTLYELGHLPFDPRVPAAVRARRPVVANQPAAKFSRQLVAIAGKLLADARTVQRAHGDGRGLFRRIAGLFF